MSRKKYTVLVPFPTGGGHYAVKGSTVELLDVQALALRQAGRVALIDLDVAPVTNTKAAKAAAKDAE